ncbi:MAG: carboxypeptidase M32, partial [Candidatus Hydrogenedentes bacterium]|nr:carboxypeptidase M32 [Candidatus Hydrogenedentota bacterium]
MPPEKMTAMREHLGQVIDMNAAIALMHWDQEVFMPPKAAPMRGQQLATLSAHAHRMLVDPEFGELLNELGEDDSLDSDEACLVSETRYDVDRATKLPESFVQRFAEEQSKAYQAWVAARENGDFNTFRPKLETMVELLREKAELMGYEGSPYNALLEDYERGMTTEQLRTIFSELADYQSELVERILGAPDQPQCDWLDQQWDVNAQWDVTLRVLADIGYDFDAGRQDKSVHPFTTNFGIKDVRVTTRVHPGELFSALTGSIHEGGHGLYEQGFLDTDERTTLAQAPSLGIHESQSRMWENIIGRSLPFWK